MKEVKAVVMTFVLYCPTTETQGMGGRRPVAPMFLNLQLYVLHHFFFFFFKHLSVIFSRFQPELLRGENEGYSNPG